jgi:hypothetical protein
MNELVVSRIRKMIILVTMMAALEYLKKSRGLDLAEITAFLAPLGVDPHGLAGDFADAILSIALVAIPTYFAPNNSGSGVAEGPIKRALHNRRLMIWVGSILGVVALISITGWVMR